MSVSESCWGSRCSRRYPCGASSAWSWSSEAGRLQGGHHLGQVHQRVGRQRAQVGDPLVVGVVAQDQRQALGDAGAQLLGLEVDEPAVGPELDEVALDLLGDPAHHLARLEHRHDVAHRDRVLHLEPGQRRQGVVVAGAEALQGGQRLARAVDEPAGRLRRVLAVVAVHRNGRHRLGDGDHRHVDGAGHPLGRAVARAGLRGGDGGLGDEVHVGPGDARGVGGQDDGAVHLGQLGQALGRVLRIEQEAARADGEDGGVVADQDQRPVLGLQYPVEALAEPGARRDHRQRVVQRLAAAGTVGHPGIVPGPPRAPASDRARPRASASVRTPCTRHARAVPRRVRPPSRRARAPA